MRLGLSHLNKHKFSHGFLDTVNPMCSCNSEEESTTHFLLRCPNYNQQRLVPMNEAVIIYPDISFLNENEIVKTLIYGNNLLSAQLNRKLISATINYIKLSERFDDPLISVQ